MKKTANSYPAYDVATILKYLNGQMSREDLRFFERAMLDDDMLADAVEGYKLLQKSSSDIEIIKKLETLNQSGNKKSKQNDNQLFKISFIKNLGYAVAASFVLAAGWWLYSISRPDTVLPVDSTSKELLEAPVKDEVKTENEKPDPLQELNNLPEANRVETPSATPKDTHKEKKGSMIPRTEQKLKVFPKTETEKLQEYEQESVAMNKELDDSALPMKRMVTSSDRGKMQYRFTWLNADSIRISPENGWNEYKKFLSEQIMDIAPLQKAGKATLTIDEKGKVIETKIDGPFTLEEIKALDKEIKKGPLWKNRTGQNQEATIQWE